MAPEDLSTDIDRLYEQLQVLPEFENESCRRAFPGFIEKARLLHDFSQVRDYRVVFIGEPGKGKTTAICNWLGLLRADKSNAKRIDDVSLLATGTGRTTVAEVHIRQIQGQSRLRLEYMSLVQQRAYIREYAGYYFREAAGISAVSEESKEADSTKSDTHIEMDRVVRNMAGLQEITLGDKERAAVAISGFNNEDSFYSHILDVIDLENRQCPEIEKRPDEDFETWLRKTFKDVNDGKRQDCSIANVIYVDVSKDDLDLMLPTFVAEVIDTKGLDSAAAARMDLQKLMKAEDTICFVMDDVRSVPSDNVRNLLKRTFLNERDAYYQFKTSIFVKSSEAELEGVNGADGDADRGIELKTGEIRRRVVADDIPYDVENTVFLDSCCAYEISTVREKVYNSKGEPVIDQRTKTQKIVRKNRITYYGDAADVYRNGLTIQITSLIDHLKGHIEADTVEVRDSVAKLLEIERKTNAYAVLEELRKTKQTIEESRGTFLQRFRDREVRKAILDLAIDRIHWATIRKMNSLYGAYESWHTDIYTQIMQAGRECFADFIKPMSDYVHDTLEGIEDAEVRSVALGCLSQFDQMVKAATDNTGNRFLRWALDEGFAPQNDNNPFWLDVNQLKGLGYKRMVREAYSKHIEDDAAVLAKEVDEKANKVVDDLLELLTEEPAQE